MVQEVKIWGIKSGDSPHIRGRSCLHIPTSIGSYGIEPRFIAITTTIYERRRDQELHAGDKVSRSGVSDGL